MSDEPTTLTPLHEREEFRAMRDRMAESFVRELQVDRERAWQLANKIAPVCYIAVEQQCVGHHLNAVQGARGMMLALNRITQLDAVRYAVDNWRKSAAITYLLQHHPNNLSPTERGLARAIDEYNETRAKDN